MNAALIARDSFGMHDRWGDGGFHPVVALLCVIALATAIGLVVWLIMGRRPSGHVGAPPAAPTTVSPTAAAEAILAERLARSEISPDDYRTMLAALREQAPPV